MEKRLEEQSDTGLRYLPPRSECFAAEVEQGFVGSDPNLEDPVRDDGETEWW